jgi:hypothetical protein
LEQTEEDVDMSKRLQRSLVAGVGAVVVVSVLATTPVYAAGRTEERTYSYLDGKGSPPDQHVDIPSWAMPTPVPPTGRRSNERWTPPPISGALGETSAASLDGRDQAPGGGDRGLVGSPERISAGPTLV